MYIISNIKDQEILPGDPFESIDQTGVGQLMEFAIAKGDVTRV